MSDIFDDLEDEPVKPPEPPSRGFGGRWATAGMPAEKSKDFAASSRRLLGTMRPERFGAIVVLFTAIGSVSLTVIGPRVLGHGTDIIVDGLSAPGGIDFDRLRATLMVAIGLYITASVLQYVQSYLLAGVVQRTMYRLRSEVEDKINRLSLPYMDSQPRGDL